MSQVMNDILSRLNDGLHALKQEDGLVGLAIMLWFVLTFIVGFRVLNYLKNIVKPILDKTSDLTKALIILATFIIFISLYIKLTLDSKWWLAPIIHRGRLDY